MQPCSHRAVHVIVMILVLSSIFASEARAEASQGRIGIVTPYVLLEPRGDFYTGTLTYSLVDGVTSDLSLELLDVWSSESGQRSTLPPGSTPTTGMNRLTWSLSTFRYYPTGEPQLVHVDLAIPSRMLKDAPLSSALRLTVRPISSGDQPEAISLVTSAIAFVFANHQDYASSDNGFEASIKNSNLMVSYLSDPAGSAPRRIRIFLDGELALASFETSNEGTLFAFVSHVLTIRNISSWIDPLSEESVIFQEDVKQSIITPGQSRLREMPLTATLVGSDEVVSLVSNWGVYEMVLKTTYHYGGDDTFDEYQSVTFYVFPIHQAIFILVAVGFGGLFVQLQRKKPRFTPPATQGI